MSYRIIGVDKYRFVTREEAEAYAALLPRPFPDSFYRILESNEPPNYGYPDKGDDGDDE